MNKIFNISKFCPISNRTCKVTLEYLDACTVEYKSYIRLLPDCDYLKLGGICSAETCVLTAGFPERLGDNIV